MQALETEDFSVFPAPVYARGFLRTYSRYLGLNPDELLRVFPNGDLVVDIAPLPTVTRAPQQLINVNWVVTGLVAVFLIGAALLLLRGGGDDPLTTPGGTNGLGTNPTTGPSSTIGSQVQIPSVSGSTTAATGRQIGPASPGELPNFVGADVASSRAILTANQIRYTIIEYVDSKTARGIVVDQTPDGGSKTNDGAMVTLYVSAGASLQGVQQTQ